MERREDYPQLLTDIGRIHEHTKFTKEFVEKLDKRLFEAEVGEIPRLHNKIDSVNNRVSGLFKWFYRMIIIAAGLSGAAYGIEGLINLLKTIGG